MARSGQAPNTVRARLVYGPSPDVETEETPTQFGLQDKKQEVHPGVERRDGSTLFEFDLQLRGEAGGGAPDFGGAFVHGTAGARFLYLSWKRTQGGPSPWVRRVKIPLGSITWEQIREAQTTGGFIEADVIGRLPHDTRRVIWKPARGR